jgi:hypothetical protein
LPLQFPRKVPRDRLKEPALRARKGVAVIAAAPAAKGGLGNVTSLCGRKIVESNDVAVAPVAPTVELTPDWGDARSSLPVHYSDSYRGSNQRSCSHRGPDYHGAVVDMEDDEVEKEVAVSPEKGVPQVGMALFAGERRAARVYLSSAIEATSAKDPASLALAATVGDIRVTIHQWRRRRKPMSSSSAQQSGNRVAKSAANNDAVQKESIVALDFSGHLGTTSSSLSTTAAAANANGPNTPSGKGRGDRKHSQGRYHA